MAALCNISAIFSGALLPVPLLQTFCLQAGIISCLQALSALFLQPALLSLDLQRRRTFHVDILCCLTSHPDNPLTLAGRPRAPIPGTGPASASGPDRPLAARCLRLLSPRVAVQRLLVPCLRRLPAKALVVTAAAATVGASGFGIAQLSYGLDFATVVPRDSQEHAFVEAHNSLLGVYNFQVRSWLRHLLVRETSLFSSSSPQVSTGEAFDYANGQRLLRRFFESLRRVPEVMGAEPGPPAAFWLDALRDWLLTIQAAYRADVRRGAIDTRTGNWSPNATRDGLTGLLLLVQTGRDQPLDLTRVSFRNSI